MGKNKKKVKATKTAGEQVTEHLDAAHAQGTRLSNEPEHFVGGRVEGPTVELALDKIRVHEDRNKRHFPVSDASIRELADSIRDQGLINPLVVFPVEENGDGATHQLDAGYQRYKALKLLMDDGHPVPVRATVISGPNEAVNLGENVFRNDLSAMDKAYILKNKVDAGAKKGEAGKLIKVSPAQVTRLLALTTLRKGIQEKIHKGLVPARVQAVLPDLSEKEQDELLASLETDKHSGSKRAAKAKRKAGKKGNQGRKRKFKVDPEELAAAVEGQVEAVKAQEKQTAADKKALELYACLKGFLAGTMSMKALSKRVLVLVAPR